jgi:L-alanine-DL-glutamate epimerase-like enolase superfamily enzyme
VTIFRIDTLRLAEFPNLLWVEIATGDGLVGLGETFYGAEAVEAYVHESAAPVLLGADPLLVEAHAAALRGYVGDGAAGAESRGRSAVDIALWDLWGKATGQPLHQLIGGRVRETAPIYNTCAGYRYVRRLSDQRVDNWGLPSGAATGPYEDLDGFLHHAERVAESLLDMGVGAMKIWPFDPYAEASDGTWIGADELERGLEPLRRIRAAVGSRIDVMVELHGLWDVPTAKRIVRALEPFGPRWVEDPVRSDDADALAAVAGASTVPVAAGETLAGVRAFRRLAERRAVDVVILDPTWCGGIGEARRIAAVAGAYGLPVAAHDCTGPVGLAVGAHLSIALQNALAQETVRAFYYDWYAQLAGALPPIEAGRIAPAPGPGHGVALRPELRSRADAVVRTSGGA